jgi:TPM domain
MRIVRIVRLLVLLAVTALIAALATPPTLAEPPFRLKAQLTDNADALSPTQKATVTAAVDKLYHDRRIQLWVVYVKSFDGRGAIEWAGQTMAVSDFGDNNALLAVATDDRAFAFQVPSTVRGGTPTKTDELRRNDIEPALHRGDWAGAAVAAADGLNANAAPGTALLDILLIAAALIAFLVLLLWGFTRRRRRSRHKAELAAAKRLEPTDANALATVPLEALDELSKVIVVDVDNAVRTSESELALAVEEFGAPRTAPFKQALDNAKAALAQAFNARQTLDDDVPEAPLLRRDLLTRVIVAAGRADRELESQNTAFHQLRDLIINAPDRLGTLTQQMVALTARLEPAEQAMAALRQQFSDSALASVSGNVETAGQRLTFADKGITTARSLVSRPATDQTALVDAVRGAEGALGQAQTLLDAIDNVSSDITRAVADLPARIADIQTGIDQAAQQLDQPDTPHEAELTAARDAAVKAAAGARDNGATDPLGTFVRLTEADAELDRLLATVTQQRQEDETQARMLQQAISTAQYRIRAVSDFIDTRRGSVGPEARTRLAEATRHLEAAQAKEQSNPTEAIAHANGAASLAAQAQSLANEDVNAAHRAYSSQYGRSSDLGSVIGGVIIGNILRGGVGGWGGGYGGDLGGSWGGGRNSGRPTSYGGSSNSSGRSYSGGGGRF